MEAYPENVKESARSSQDGSEQEERHTYVSLYLRGSRLAWILYCQGQASGQGIVSETNGIIEGRYGLVSALQATKAADGFVVAFCMKDVDLWVRTRLMHDVEVWGAMNKSGLQSLDMFRLFDDDCYDETWTLVRLHEEMFGPARHEKRSRVEQGRVAAAAELTGDIFEWYVTRFEAKYLEWKGPYRNRELLLKLDRPPNGYRPAPDESWDTILAAPPRPYADRVKYVVVDVETHDWEERAPGTLITRQTCIGRIVEIAWIACDEEGREIERKNYLIRPHAYETIARKASKVHGLSTRRVREQGSEAALVFSDFVQLLRNIPPDGFVIAHNMHHEDSAIPNNLMNPDDLLIWDSIPKACTWAPSLLRFLPNALRFKNRSCGLKLAELHQIALGGRESHLHERAHSALADVLMTWGVFQYYKQRVAESGEDVSKLSWTHTKKRKWNGQVTFVQPDSQMPRRRRTIWW